MDWNRFWALFHKAWGQAHDAPEYDKKVYTEMMHMLKDAERDMIDIKSISHSKVRVV